MNKPVRSYTKSIVIFVSDDRFMHLIIKDVLSKQNVIVYDVYSADEALKLLATTVPDLILSDLDMPETDGLELCKMLKDSTTLSKIPFVIYSSSESEDIITKAYATGAKGYIVKKFTVDVLAEKILHFIK